MGVTWAIINHQRLCQRIMKEIHERHQHTGREEQDEAVRESISVCRFMRIESDADGYDKFGDEVYVVGKSLR